MLLRIVKFKVCLLIFLVSFVLAGCTSMNHQVGEMLNLDTDLKLEFVVDEQINPDEQNTSSPVFVRFYELTSSSAFSQADFIDLYERDEEVLGDTFISKQELKRLVPNTFRKETFVLSKETRFVGLFAEFYDYDDAQSKVVFEVTSSNVIRNSVGVQISGNKMMLVNIKHRKNDRNRKTKTYNIEQK